jgi:YYY domain-containing protein
LVGFSSEKSIFKRDPEGRSQVNGILQLVDVATWLLLIKGIQLALYPALRNGFGKLSYAAAYPVSVLLFTLFTWYAGYIGIPVQVALIPFLILFAYCAAKGEYSAAEIKCNLSWDVIFLLGFLFLLEVRYFNPSISYAEKFMDHAFLASIMRTPAVPPLDPWFAGGSLAIYYYLGHWMMGTVAITAGVPSPVAFNLILPTVFGLSAVSLYAIGTLLLRRFQFIPVLTLFAVNPSFILHLVSGEGLLTILWESTRTIEGAITEYPLFSMLWGDPHAHVISFFNQAFLIFTLIVTYLHWDDLDSRGRWILSGTIALSLGTMPLLNSWDVLVYAPVVLIFGFLTWRGGRSSLQGGNGAWKLLLLVPLLSIALYLPSYFMLDTKGIDGIGLVSGPTGIVPFLLVFGFFIAIFLVEIKGEIVRYPLLIAPSFVLFIAGYGGAAAAFLPLTFLAARRRCDMADLLAIIGLSILTFIEIVYLADNMTGIYYRMNTVFKFSMIAWMFMGIAASVMVSRWLISRRWYVPDHLQTAAAVVIALLLLTVPLGTQEMALGYGSRTLDGLAYLNATHPADAAAVQYLRSLGGDLAIVEAEGDDYTYASRISSFSGIPTLIGMPGHELMWRGSEAGIGERRAAVRAIYEDESRTIDLMTEYGIPCVYIGPLEEEQYNIRIPFSLLEKRFDQQGARIYCLPGDDSPPDHTQ